MRRTGMSGGAGLAGARYAPIALCAAMLAWFGWQAPAFLQAGNLVNILVQSSSAAIVAIGMTYVLLVAGIDLSVGSIMLVSAALAGKAVLAGQPLWSALGVALAVGLGSGAVHALLIARLRIVAFVVTLATLFLGRGLGLWITRTRAMNLPDSLLQLGTGSIAGVPFPILVFLAVLIPAHVVLTRTQFGRQVYATGNDAEAARKAGIPVGRIVGLTYVICGACAAVGGLVSVAQLGAVSPTFGFQREFAAVAAAVLGGTSLFGGRGSVFPGTVLGAILIQTVENGLVMINADPYLYPLVMGAILFAAVLADSARQTLLREAGRRRIRALTCQSCQNRD